MPTVAIDLPRRHLLVGDARLDRPRPRPRLGVGHERHRRDRVGPVTRLALLLEDRRDVLGERRRLRRRRRPQPRLAPAAAALSAHDADRHVPSPVEMFSSHHVRLPSHSTARSLSRRCWSSSTETRRRPRPIRRWPGRAAGIRRAPRTSPSRVTISPCLVDRDARLVERHLPGTAELVERDRRHRWPTHRRRGRRFCLRGPSDPRPRR